MTGMGVGVGVSVGVAVGVAVGVRVGVGVSVGKGVGVAKIGALHASTISKHSPMTTAAVFRFMAFSLSRARCPRSGSTSPETRLISQSAWSANNVTQQDSPHSRRSLWGTPCQAILTLKHAPPMSRALSFSRIPARADRHRHCPAPRLILRVCASSNRPKTCTASSVEMTSGVRLHTIWIATTFCVAPPEYTGIPVTG
jgi:hypothetical protein